MAIPTQEQYEKAERNRLAKALHEVESASLLDRKEAKVTLAKCLRSELNHCLKLASWILEGSYGFGSYQYLRGLTKRSNRNAALFQMLAALEFNCPRAYANQVFNELDKAMKDAINLEFEKLWADVDQEMEEEAKEQAKLEDFPC